MSEFKIGDIVSWTHKTHRGSNTIVLSAWEGKIVAIDGVTYSIKRHSQIYKVGIARIRSINQRNELTELVMGKEEGKK